MKARLGMKKTLLHPLPVSVTTVLLCCWLPAAAYSDGEAPQISVTMQPVRYISVKGEDDQFRARYWMNDGYGGGIKNFYLQDEFAKDASVWFEGYTLTDHDQGAEMLLKKKDAGFMKLDYKGFRKYYDNIGGRYHPFTTFGPHLISHSLDMDIDHMAFEVGTPLDESAGLGLFFERHVKDGTKSRLTWTGVTEGATTRRIGPSWQDIDEEVNVFGLNARGGLIGFDVSGEQRFEVVDAYLRRVEQNFSTTAGSGRMIRIQQQEPEAALMSTSLQAQRWLNDDRTFLSFAYRYAKMKSEEAENLNEFDEEGHARNFSTSPKDYFGADAESEYDSHTWVTNLTNNLTKHFAVITKFRVQNVQKEGSSIYPLDSTQPAPDGTIDETQYSDMDSDFWRYGENVGLRYQGIPKTSIYADLDLEQTDGKLSEDRDSRNSTGVIGSGSSGEIFRRETETGMARTVATLGTRIVPLQTVNVTMQLRRRMERNDYDDISETTGGGTARSAFFNALDIHANEVTSRLTWKPQSWLQTSVRHQYTDGKYKADIEDGGKTTSLMTSHIFTYDVVLTPLAQLLVDIGFSRQQAKTATPAGVASSTRIPGFNADVNTWLFSASYSPCDRLSLTNSFHFSQTNNFNDFTSSAMPMGMDYDEYNVDTGLAWRLKDDMTIEPHYAYYRYAPDPSAAFGGYSAHAGWVDVNFIW